MTQAELAYGERIRAVSLPAGLEWSLVPEAPAAATVTVEDVRSALDRATVGPPLGALLDEASHVGLVVPDRTRPAGMDVVLPALFEWLAEGDGARRVSLLVGGGAHAPDEGARWVARVPEPWRPRVSLHVHDARDDRALVSVGTTTRGTPVFLHRALEDVDAVVVTGAIGYHYFAGFSGGRKGIFPGLAGVASIQANHRHVLSETHDELHDACRPGNLLGNPVHEDATEAVRLLKRPIFLVNVLAREDGAPEDVVTGDLVEAHRIGCERYLARHAVSLDAPADVVLADAGGAPRDVDLVQAHKALLHAASIVRDGGTLIFLAECAGGVGSRTMVPWFDHETSAAMARAMRDAYTLNAHTALSFRRITERVHVRFVTELPDALCRKAGAEPAPNAEVALAEAAARERGGRGLVVRSPTTRVFRIGGSTAA